MTESLRKQTEQNQVLRKFFSELEKELRSLTETRLELEIKLDYLNTASTASAVINNSLQSSSIGINSVINATPTNQMLSSTTTTTTTTTTTNPTNSSNATSASQINVKKLPQSKSNNIASNGTPITMSTSTTTPQISSLSNSSNQAQILSTPVSSISSSSKI
jgi:hypothetical protein